MRSAVVKTAVVTSLVTALAVSLLTYVFVPRFTNGQNGLMDPAAAQAQGAYVETQPGVTLVGYTQSGQPVYSAPPNAVAQNGQPMVYAQPVQRVAQRPVVYSQPAVAKPAPTRRVISSSSDVYQGERDVYGEPVEKGRSKGKSVAIVAGSAGAGAAIGGLAGGGKGAAIGAISGGVAGLVYDRMTAKPKQQ